MNTLANFLSVVAGNLGANRTAQSHHALIDDAVVDLNTIATTAQDTRLIQGVQVLRHIGLGGLDVFEIGRAHV